MVTKQTRKKIIIIVATIVVLFGAGAAAYVFDLTPGFFKLIPGLNAKYSDADSGSDGSNDTDTSGTSFKESLVKVQGDVAGLIEKKDSESIQQADTIVASEVAAATESKNDDYIVYASLMKAKLLTETDRAQEALDGVLLPLAEEYGKNGSYRNDIYIGLSLAYTQLGNTTKADEYMNQTTGRGGE